LVALAVAVLGSASLSAGSAYASGKAVTHTAVVEQSLGFFCGGSVAANGFGKATFKQNGNALTGKFNLVNAPPNTTVDVEITQCDSFGGFVSVDNLGTVTTDGKGRVKRSFRDTLDGSTASYFLCLDPGGRFEWGTQPIPVA